MKKKFKAGELRSMLMQLHVLNGKKYPAEMLRAINANKKKLEIEIDTTEKSRVEIMKNYCVKDGNGMPVFDEDNHYTFANDEIHIAATSEVNELWNTEVEMDVCMVSFAAVARCDSDKFDTLTGADYDALEFMIE